jgi:hypothetical protein
VTACVEMDNCARKQKQRGTLVPGNNDRKQSEEMGKKLSNLQLCIKLMDRPRHT